MEVTTSRLTTLRDQHRELVNRLEKFQAPEAVQQNAREMLAIIEELIEYRFSAMERSER
jgi:hypothetical protein